jgi:hypothetical protein
MRPSTASEGSSIPPSRSDADAHVYVSVSLNRSSCLYIVLYMYNCFRLLRRMPAQAHSRLYILVARCKMVRVYNLSSMRTTLWRRRHHPDTLR